MHISKFINNPDETPLHDSGLVAKTSEETARIKEQSFTERQRMEQLRSLVAGYKDSLIARQAPSRRELGRYKKPEQQSRAQLQSPSRQEYNAGGDSSFVRPVQKRRFQEPSQRGYNPYS